MTTHWGIIEVDDELLEDCLKDLLHGWELVVGGDIENDALSLAGPCTVGEEDRNPRSRFREPQNAGDDVRLTHGGKLSGHLGAKVLAVGVKPGVGHGRVHEADVEERLLGETLEGVALQSLGNPLVVQMSAIG